MNNTSCIEIFVKTTKGWLYGEQIKINLNALILRLCPALVVVIFITLRKAKNREIKSRNALVIRRAHAGVQAGSLLNSAFTKGATGVRFITKAPHGTGGSSSRIQEVLDLS